MFDKIRQFTLIEVMIVVAIIGIVVSLFFGMLDARSCHDQVMSDCMRDGKQAYECKSIANTACYRPSQYDWDD